MNLKKISFRSWVIRKIRIFVFNSIETFFDFLILKNTGMLKLSYQDRSVLFFLLKSRATGLSVYFYFSQLNIKLRELLLGSNITNTSKYILKYLPVHLSSNFQILKGLSKGLEFSNFRWSSLAIIYVLYNTHCFGSGFRRLLDPDPDSESGSKVKKGQKC